MALTCLIVDDNADFLEVARDLLERQGIAVVGVASASAEALQRADELRPDVTLVDIELGGESGFDLTDRLASGRDGRRSSVILVSTYAEKDFADLIAPARRLASCRSRPSRTSRSSKFSAARRA